MLVEIDPHKTAISEAASTYSHRSCRCSRSVPSSALNDPNFVEARAINHARLVTSIGMDAFLGFLQAISALTFRVAHPSSEDFRKYSAKCD